MKDTKFCIIGAGAMGCVYGGLLAQKGSEVCLVDTWKEHIQAIQQNGLYLDGITGDLHPSVSATDSPEKNSADVALILTNAYSTQNAAETAKHVLKPEGYAITLQNGVGNIEILTGVLGKERVLAGLSFHSGMVQGPGHVTHTHEGPTWLGELEGQHSERLALLESLFEPAKLMPAVVDNIIGFIWDKFIHNSAINPISAATGLRVGEIARSPAADQLQTKIIEEAIAVIQAKGIVLNNPDPMTAIKNFCKIKFNKPSMQQHVEAGKLTEIDALNGTIVREGKILGIPTPYNEALTWIVKALEAQRKQALHGPAKDYEALEKEAKKEK